MGLRKICKNAARALARLGGHRDGDGDANPNIAVGRHTYKIGPATILGATPDSPVTIGSFCSIAPGVTFLGHVEHNTRLPSTFPFRTQLKWRDGAPPGGLNHDAVTRGPIVVGHDVWIGQNALVLSGVTIGTGAVVGAGTLVARDVPPYAIVAGNPAKQLRFRFEPEIIEQLLETAWWTLPDETLRRLEPSLYTPDLTAFLAAVRREGAGE